MAGRICVPWFEFRRTCVDANRPVAGVVLACLLVGALQLGEVYLDASSCVLKALR